MRDPGGLSGTVCSSTTTAALIKFTLDTEEGEYPCIHYYLDCGDRVGYSLQDVLDFLSSFAKNDVVASEEFRWTALPLPFGLPHANGRLGLRPCYSTSRSPPPITPHATPRHAKCDVQEKKGAGHRVQTPALAHARLETSPSNQ